MCVEACKTRAFQYAGLEYSQEVRIVLFFQSTYALLIVHSNLVLLRKYL